MNDFSYLLFIFSSNIALAAVALAYAGISLASERWSLGLVHIARIVFGVAIIVNGLLWIVLNLQAITLWADLIAIVHIATGSTILVEKRATFACLLMAAISLVDLVISLPTEGIYSVPWDLAYTASALAWAAILSTGTVDGDTKSELSSST